MVAKKRKKVSDVKPAKAAAKIAPRPIQPTAIIPTKPDAKGKDILNPKDRQILSEMDKIIWNPSLLNKFKDAKEQLADGHEKKKLGK